MFANGASVAYWKIFICGGSHQQLIQIIAVLLEICY